jgi:4-amino-4-deoxy-L-arabinose transferase-like glycosyltransferase
VCSALTNSQLPTSKSLGWKSARRRRQLVVAGALLITLFGGLLRFEAVVANYGWMGQPGWSLAFERHVVPIVKKLHPESIVWGPNRNPYVGGDPINYLRFAREMRSFYQAHVREPVFLALTRGFLWMSGGRDIAVSYASAFAGTLAILATFLLGVAMGSRAAGLAAALALAIEYQAITWSMDGWRDDTFMLFVTLSAASLIVVSRQPTRLSAVLAGVAAAGACLTRISSLSFIVPALIWMVAMPGPVPRRIAARHAGIVALVCAALTGPYLFNCWRATGDPLYALNYHARYYRSAEGLVPDESVGALQYASAKLASRPIATLDTASQGLVTVPFFNKWNGWAPWASWIGPVLRAFAALGVLLAVWLPRGRLLLVIMITSLVPYALTWSVGGGGEWRFTQHVYPAFLVLAFLALAAIVAGIRYVVRTRHVPLVLSRQHRRQAIAMAAAVLIGLTGFAIAPFLVMWESLAAGDAVNVTAGDRDRLFFAGRWSEPMTAGAVTVRVAQAELVSLRLPMPEAAYQLTLRLDPPLTADPSSQPTLTVFLNRKPLARLDMTRDPVRVGTYRIQVPKESVSAVSRLDLLATHTIRAGDAGPPFEPLPPDSPTAFRLWYVRLEKIP